MRTIRDIHLECQHRDKTGNLDCRAVLDRNESEKMDGLCSKHYGEWIGMKAQESINTEVLGDKGQLLWNNEEKEFIKHYIRAKKTTNEIMNLYQYTFNDRRSDEALRQRIGILRRDIGIKDPAAKPKRAKIIIYNEEELGFLNKEINAQFSEEQIIKDYRVVFPDIPRSDTGILSKIKDLQKKLERPDDDVKTSDKKAWNHKLDKFIVTRWKADMQLEDISKELLENMGYHKSPAAIQGRISHLRTKEGWIIPKRHKGSIKKVKEPMIDETPKTDVISERISELSPEYRALEERANQLANQINGLEIQLKQVNSKKDVLDRVLEEFNLIKSRM